MALAAGDMVQYDMIKRMGVGDYLTKLDNWTKDIERQIAANKK